MLMLDVIPGEDQMREEFALATYGSVPKVRLHNPAVAMPLSLY
jgi:hypothetical protein